MRRWALLAALAVALGIVACGGTTRTPCTSGGDCAEEEICHPTASFCVKGCSVAADCAPTEPICATLAGSSPFCQCSDDPTCNGAGQVCSTVHHVCLDRCHGDGDCPGGGACDTSTGQCGRDPQASCGLGTCASGACDFATGLCGAALSCNAAQEQPDVCPYGQFCSTGTCAEVPKATCANFSSGRHPAVWGVGSKGSIIWSISRLDVTQNDSFCSAVGATNTRYKVRVHAYSGGGSFPQSDGTVHGPDEAQLERMLHLVDPAGNELSPTNTVQNLSTTHAQHDAGFDVSFCRVGTTSSYSAGMHFIGGNEVCLLVN